MLGRRVYLLLVIMPIATVTEGLGIALLAPLFTSLGSAGVSDGKSGKALSWLGLSASPAFLLFAIAIAFAVKAALKFAATALRGQLEAKLICELRIKMAGNYANLEYMTLVSRNTGHYINIVNGQIKRFSKAFSIAFQTLMQAGAAFVYLAFVAVVSWQFALLALSAGVAFVVLLRGLTRMVQGLSRSLATEQSTLNKQLVQYIQSLKYLVATGQTQPVVQTLKESCNRVYQYQYKTAIATAFTSSLREPVSVGIILSLIAVQIFVFKENLQSTLVALLLLDRGMKAMLSVQSGWQSVSGFFGSVELVLGELQLCREREQIRGDIRLGRFSSQVCFENVSFAYKDAPVIQRLSMAIPFNQTVALVGHSGCGKSTLVDLLTLSLRPNAGKILIDSVDSMKVEPLTWRSQLGFVSQETVVFDDTVSANICLDSRYTSDSECQARIRAAAEQAFALDFIESLPNGFETVVGDRGTVLSGGQRQRLFIARELFKRPSLLILDEATSALDGASEAAIQQSIDALRGKISVVLIAHRLATVQNADLIYVIENGQVVEQGTFTELNSREGSRFRQMVEIQSI